MKSLQSTAAITFLTILIIIGVYCRLSTLNIPPILTADEASIVLNASDVLQTGRDEWGIRFPLFFKAFGEYKSPIFIYSLVPLVAIFDLSLQTIRLGAALWGLVTAFLLALVTYRLTKIIQIALIILIITLFLPGLFSLSHLGLEAVTLPALTSLALLLLTSKKATLTVATAFIWGLTVYAYPTARFLSPIYFILALTFVITKPKERLLLIIIYLTTITPFIIAIIQNPAIIFARLNQVSILTQRQPLLSLVNNIVKFLSPDFLFIHGSPDLLFSTQTSGLLLVTTIPLLIMGLVVLIKKAKRGDNWSKFLLLATLLSPLAAILTYDNQPHLLRISNLLPFLVILISYGVYYSLKKIPTPVIIALGLAFIFEAGLYLYDFTLKYPYRVKTDQAAHVNEVAGFKKSDLSKYYLHE